MRKLFTLFSLVVSFPALSQNYNCLQFGAKNYFINGNGNVRGIRIDSIRSAGADTFFYAYRTMRTSNIVGWGAGTDTLGASWLGKNVIKHTDGTFVFDNMWDTVFIKTAAHTGDSWSFFTDSVSSFKATVLSEDTMTVSGTLDSIKTIAILCDNMLLPQPGDSLQNFQIILSKNHGFVQTFDLYTFPYRGKTTSISREGFDYYLDLLLENVGYCDVCIPHPPTVTNSVFRLFQLTVPTTMQIYDFAIGDVFENRSTLSQPSWGGTDKSVETSDSILGKTATPFSVSYSGMEHSHTITYVTTVSTTSYSSSVYTANGDTTLLFSNQLMPEEWNAPSLLRYYPKSLIIATCDSSEVWVVAADKKDYTHGTAWDLLSGYLIPAFTEWSYAKGLGIVAMRQYPAGPFGSDVLQQYDVYYYKNGTGCGSFVNVLPNEVPVLKQAGDINITPNPANKYILVSTTLENTTASIFDLTGRCLSQTKIIARNNTTINTSQLPNGLYIISVGDNASIVHKEKIAILH